MAFIDGVGLASLGSVTGVVTASPGHTPYSLIPQQPENASRQGSTAVPLVAILSITDGTLADVQVEVSSNVGFTSIVGSTTLTNKADGLIQYVVSGLTNNTQYWWHMRPSLAGAGSWGSWTTTQTFTVDINHSKAWGDIGENVGFDPHLIASSNYGHIDENIGVPVLLKSSSFGEIYLNGGVEIDLSADGFGYIGEGDVNALTPTPIIWFLRPTAGREGDGIEVIGFGFGDLQTTYNGLLEIDLGDVFGWTGLAVTSWQTFPPDANAYTDDRVLDPASGQIDMQHQIIGLIVPNGAIPPGYPIRVVTDGA